MQPSAKQKLSFAIAGVVSASARQLAPVSASVPASSACKTNPNSPAAAPADKSTASPMSPPSSVAPSASGQSPAQSAGQPVSASERQLALVSASERPTPMAKTNPPPLSSRQLAGARLLASGVPPTEVAQQLGMSRGGLLKWRKQPAFLAEVRRMHEWRAYAYGVAVGDAHRAAGRRPR